MPVNKQNRPHLKRKDNRAIKAQRIYVGVCVFLQYWLIHYISFGWNTGQKIFAMTISFTFHLISFPIHISSRRHLMTVIQPSWKRRNMEPLNVDQWLQARSKQIASSCPPGVMNQRRVKNRDTSNLSTHPTPWNQPLSASLCGLPDVSFTIMTLEARAIQA